MQVEERRIQNATILETVDRLTRLGTPRALELITALWEDLAEIDVGWLWHDVGPDGVLAAAQEFLEDVA